MKYEMPFNDNDHLQSSVSQLSTLGAALSSRAKAIFDRHTTCSAVASCGVLYAACAHLTGQHATYCVPHVGLQHT